MDKFLLGVMIGLLFWFAYNWNSLPKKYTVYDCRLAEISVDYPHQVKTQCRNLK